MQSKFTAGQCAEADFDDALSECVVCFFSSSTHARRTRERPPLIRDRNDALTFLEWVPAYDRRSACAYQISSISPRDAQPRKPCSELVTADRLHSDWILRPLAEVYHPKAESHAMHP